MSSKRRKTPVQAALIRLRKSLGLTQQQFSDALGVTMISVSRWETSRPPTGLSLAQLERFARDKGELEIAAAFLKASDQDRPKHFFKTPLPPDEDALRELRSELHSRQRSGRESARLRSAYLRVLRVLRDAHAELFDPYQDDQDYTVWTETQKNLEWMLKEKEGQR